MRRRLDYSPAMLRAETTILPPFSNLIQHERVEWHKNSSSSSTGQSTPSSSPLDLRDMHLGEDSRGSSISSSDDYQYGTRPIQIQPLTSPPDLRYRQQIPDAVIDPSLREPHTSSTRSSCKEHKHRSTQYGQEKEAFAQDFGPTRVTPRGMYETPHTYPQVTSQHYNSHNYNFCPGEVAPTTPPLLGVQIENNVETRAMYEHDREHRGIDHYARCNEGKRVDWHHHEPTTNPTWVSSYTSPNTNSSRHLPIRPRALPTHTTGLSATSTSSWPSSLHNEGQRVDWHHRGPMTSPPPFPTHTPQNTNRSEYLLVRPHTPPTNTTHVSTTSPSGWVSSSSSYDDQLSPTASPPSRFEVDESYRSYHPSHSHVPSHQTRTFEEQFPQPPKETNNIRAYPSDLSFGPLGSGRNREREEHRYETGTYGGFRSARSGADRAHADVSDNVVGRRGQKRTAAPEVAAIGVEGSVNTEQPVANVPRASSSRTTTTTHPEAGIVKSRIEASVVTKDTSITRKEASVAKKDSSANIKVQNPRRSTKGMKRGSLLMEWTGAEPPVPLPPVKSWGRPRQSSKAKAATSKTWRVNVNAAPESEAGQQAERRGGSTLDVRDTRMEHRDNTESNKSSTKKRKGDSDAGRVSTGITEEGSRAGGSQSQGTLRPRPKPRKKQKTSSPVTDAAQSSSPPPPVIIELPAHRGPFIDAVRDSPRIDSSSNEESSNAL